MVSKVRALLVSVLLVMAMQMFSTGSAAAWSGSLPACSGYPTDWESQLEADSRFNSNTSWIAFRRDWGGPPFNGQNALVVVWNQPNYGSQSQYNQLYFVGNGVDETANGMSYPIGSTTLYVVSQGGITDITSSSSGSFATMFDLNCVEDVHNVQYQSWIGDTYPDAIADYITVSLHTGTVDCGGVNPVGVNIYQNGNNGSAVVTPLSLGRAEWSYYLTGAPYAIQVLCGSDVAASFDMVSPSTASGDWVCNIIDDPHYCVLS